MILGQKISGGSSWSRDDDIAFERGLAIYADENENRWEKIATVVRGKTLEEIIEHYEILLRDVMMIESGCVPLPDYDFSEETHYKERTILECGNNRNDCEYKQKSKSKRRKGIAWTANEHRQFLLGLDKYGKGDWRSISRNFVVTRTPTQVASHAQKYFLHLKSKNKDKKRQSIHDITTAEIRSLSTKQRPIMWQNKTINVASTSNTQATLQPSLDLRPMYDTPTMWNTQATSQPSVHIPVYSTPTRSQSMVKPMLSHYGTDMNHLAPPHMPYGVQHHSLPYSSVRPSPSINMGSAPYNMTYIPKSL